MTDTTPANVKGSDLALAKTKKQRNRSITFDSLRVHAAKCSLQEKVQLRNELNASIDAEVKKLKEMADAAEKLTKPSAD